MKTSQNFHSWDIHFHGKCAANSCSKLKIDVLTSNTCACGNVCELKAETGRCRGSFPRYHFNKATGQCEEFTYGGCGGNGNNFETIEECQKTCDSPAHADCGDNQESQECGTACPLTCENMRNPPQFCTDQCIIGCGCKKGYVENAKKECVLPEQCPNQGPCKNPHEHHVTCGTSCPVTCANYNETKPLICTKDCFVGCVCDEGFYREYGRFVGRCVAKEDCPVQGENIYVGTVEEPSLTSSEFVSHISYFEDSIVRPSSPKIAPPPSPGNASIPKSPSPPTPGFTDFNKPAPVAPKNPPKKIEGSLQ
ncbi:hypothetical protein JTE90_006176 [Oedothorax gibbosus]|uniref:BPTI/Kunitz inhibitor domain-containing protein n=1 Tax=Oedothorax gibbosus TaxID=931172 RepID=A0AAV6VVV7_9ARAC|nr:hypothetical protein JTE90_006176 [Oedothorax gibbosus]